MAHAAKPNSTTRRSFLAASATLPVAAMLPMAATASEQNDLHALDFEQLSAMFDAHLLAAAVISGVYCQPRIMGAENVLFESSEKHQRELERIAAYARANPMDAREDEARRLNILRKWSAEVDDPFLDRELSAALAAYAGNRTT